MENWVMDTMNERLEKNRITSLLIRTERAVRNRRQPRPYNNI